MFRLNFTQDGPFASFGKIIYEGTPGQRFEIEGIDSVFVCVQTKEKTCCRCPFLTSSVCLNVSCCVKDGNKIAFKEFKRF